MALNEFEPADSRPNRPHVGPSTRLAIGLAVSPLVIPVALFVVFASASLAGVRKFAADDFSELIQRTAAFSAIVVSIGYGVTFILALPIITWLLNRGKATQKRVLMVGVCLGGLPFLGYFAYVAAWELWRATGFPADTPVLGVWDTISRLVRNGPEALVWLAAGVACGAATAATLLLIALDGIDAA